jgi:MFS family permease
LTILPLSLAMIVSGPFGGYLAGRVSPHRPIAVAMLLFSGGMFWLAHLTVSTGWQWLVPPFAVIGIGLGMASANINTAVMATVPRPVVGAAAGVVTTVRQLGSVLGIAVLGVVLQERESVYLARYLRGGTSPAGAQALAFTNAMNDTFLVCAAVLFAGALAALAVRYRRAEGDAPASVAGAAGGRERGGLPAPEEASRSAR